MACRRTTPTPPSAPTGCSTTRSCAASPSTAPRYPESMSGEVISPLAGLAAADTAATTSTPIIEITEAALAKLSELRDEEPDADQLGLRLEIASDPGEPFRYELGFEEYLTAAFSDEVRTHGGLKVMIPGRDVE